MGSLIFLAIGAGVAANSVFLLLSVLNIILGLYFSLCTRQRLIHRYMQDVIQAHRLSQWALHYSAKAKSGMSTY